MGNNELTERTIEEELQQLRQEVAELTKRLQSLQQSGADNDSQNNAGRKQAEERNRDRESMLEGVYRATPVGITFNVNRVILSVNESMCAITGYSERELVGSSARVLYATQEEFELAGREIYPQNPRKWPVTVETRFQRKDGAIIFVILSAAILRLQDSGTGFVVTVQDITERKRAEQALQESEGRFRSMIQQSPFSVQVFSPQGDMIDANEAFEQLWGVKKESLVGWYNILKDEQIQKLGMMAAVARGFAGEVVRTAIMDYDSVATAGEGNRRTVQGDVYPIWGASGEIHLVIVVHQDITDQKRAELEKSKLQEQLQQAMKMEAVGRLAGGIAHDFNNLLTAITGNVELARMDLDITDPATPLLDEIEKAARSAASLTRQLLAFSRQQIIEPKIVNLNALVERMHNMLLRLIGEDIELKANFDQNLDSVMVDPGQFEQVLANLVVNARDAMPGGGRLQIDTMNIDLEQQYCSQHPQVQPGRYVALIVSDTGQGMSEQVKRQLFEPFFTTKPKGIGTGLGLATAFGIVKQAGGTIDVYSEVGLGTTFKIYLPRAEAPATRLSEIRHVSNLAHGHERILVVEDNDSVRSFVQELLNRLGYAVLCAANGTEALLTTENSPEVIDLLLTDVVMPGMSGRELAERLLQLRPEIKVLFTSGYTEDVIVHHGVREEKINFIGKPYSMQTLAAKIRDVLDA